MYRYDILVNKDYPLKQSDKPKDLVKAGIRFAPCTDEFKCYLRQDAAKWVLRLFLRAKAEGIELYGVSGYRSFERQQEIYDTSVMTHGIEHAQKYIAQPGTSEHQTGLALDVSIKSLDYELEPEFGECLEGKWLKKYAPLYGFVIRYPLGKEKITGYAYEPWHIRYVTKPLAFYLTKSEKTLEEYYELKKRMNSK